MELFLIVLINGCIMGSVYALFAMGLNTQYGVARIMNIAHGEFIVFAAFITYLVVTRMGMHPLIGLVITGPVVFAITYVLHITLYRRVKNMSPNISIFEGNAILMSFGVYFIIQNLIQQKMGSVTTAYPFMAYPVEVGTATVAASNLFVLLIAVIICIVYNVFLAKTRMGKSIRAAAQDPQAASLLGIKINRVMALCFAIGGLLAACAGVLISMKEPFSATSGMSYTTVGIIIVVLGGLGSVRGAMLGGFIMGFVGTAVSTYDTGLMYSVFYLIVLVLLIVRPKGLLAR